MTEKCKCERCGRIRDVFQYTKFEVMVVEKVRGPNLSGDINHPRYAIEKEDIGEKRGLCEECAVEVNKAEYDKKCGNACGFQAPYGWVPEAGCEVHDK